MNTPSLNDNHNHKAVLLSHLMTGQKINALQALDLYQCFALSQRLGDLRREGIPIQSQFIKLPNGKKVKEYWLSPDYIKQHKEKSA